MVGCVVYVFREGPRTRGRLQHVQMTRAPSPKRRSCGAGPVDVEETELDTSLQPPPPDGGWGWVVVFASFMIHIISK